jgi:GAF domain-containing protein
MNSPKRGLNEVLNRITNKLQQDAVVTDSLSEIRTFLNVDRVVLYYFYSQWKGQVTFESITDEKFSIICSTGADDCFNLEYAELYLAGRIKAVDNIETAEISDCHRDFLRSLQVQSNLVAPVLTKGNLWGLLVAHHCQNVRPWLSTDIDYIRQYSITLGASPSIANADLA